MNPATATGDTTGRAGSKRRQQAFPVGIGGAFYYEVLHIPTNNWLVCKKMLRKNLPLN